MDDTRTPFDPSVPFTRGEALRSGLTDGQLRSRRFLTLVRGVHASATAPPTFEQTVRAVLRLSPSAALSHHSAARWWGAAVPEGSDVHLTSLGSRRPRREGVVGHRSRTPVPSVAHRGVRVTTPERTFLDLAGVLELVDLVVLGDSLVAVTSTTPARLVRAAAAYRGRGARRAREAAALVRHGVDSPMETRLRLLIVLAGLPEPVVNHILRTESGDWRYRFDLAYPLVRLAVEYDGRQHAESPEQWRGDLGRREELDAEGWRVVVLQGRDLLVTPEQALGRIVRAMRHAGMPVAVSSARWRQHFPGLVRRPA